MSTKAETPKINRREGLPDSAEVRLAAGPVELRRENGKRTLHGYAAIFNSESKDLGFFTEVIRPGAFSRALAENPDVSARIQHEGGLSTIGRTTNKSLRLGEDDKGLWYEADLPDTTAGNDIATLVEGKYIDKSSFAFDLRYDEGIEPVRWHRNQEPYLRELFNLNLYDVAPVDGPAYEATSVMIRDGAKDTVTAIEIAEHRVLCGEIDDTLALAAQVRWGSEDKE